MGFGRHSFLSFFFAWIFQNNPGRYIAKSFELQVGTDVEVSHHSVPSRWNSISTGYACPVTSAEDGANNMYTILLIVLVLMLIGALPAWPYSSGWGYYPSGGLGLVLIIVLVLVLMGRV